MLTLDEIKELPLPDLLTEYAEVVPATDSLVQAYNSIWRTGSFGVEWYDSNMQLQTVNIRFRHEGIPDVFKQFIHDFCTELCAKKVLIEDMISKKV